MPQRQIKYLSQLTFEIWITKNIWKTSFLTLLNKIVTNIPKIIKFIKQVHTLENLTKSNTASPLIILYDPESGLNKIPGTYSWLQIQEKIMDLKNNIKILIHIITKYPNHPTVSKITSHNHQITYPGKNLAIHIDYSQYPLLNHRSPLTSPILVAPPPVVHMEQDHEFNLSRRDKPNHIKPNPRRHERNHHTTQGNNRQE